MKGKWQGVFEPFENTFTVTWHWKQQTFSAEWKRVERDVFFRPRGENPRFVWHHYLPSHIPFTPLDVARRVGIHCSSLGGARRFFWVDNTPVLTYLGGGLVPHDDEEIARGFKLNYKTFQPWLQAEMYLFAPQDFMEEQLLLMMNQPDSELNQAKRWIAEYEDDFSVIEMKRGDKNLFRRLLTSLPLIIDPQWHGRKGKHFPFERFRNGDLCVRTYGNNGVQYQWALLLNQHFPCSLTPRVLALQRGRWEKSYQVPSFLVVSPTAHERLEALLLWRDFLRDKLPPEEIAALLTPFAT